MVVSERPESRAEGRNRRLSAEHLLDPYFKQPALCCARRLLGMECRASHRHCQGCPTGYIIGPALPMFKKLFGRSLSNCEVVLNYITQNNSTRGSGGDFTVALHCEAGSSVRAAVSIGNLASLPS